MRIKSITMNDDEMPETLTVDLTVDEAAIIYALTGTTVPKLVSDTVGLQFGNALYDVADCLSGGFFNRFWENGVKELIPLRKLKVVDEGGYDGRRATTTPGRSGQEPG